ncbi:hypothetical protein BG000_007627, partial [Podila horticola]
MIINYLSDVQKTLVHYFANRFFKATATQIYHDPLNTSSDVAFVKRENLADLLLISVIHSQ